MSKYNDNECGICLDNIDDKPIDNDIAELCCGHIFHKNCIDKWFSKIVNTCPNCRKVQQSVIDIKFIKLIKTDRRCLNLNYVDDFITSFNRFYRFKLWKKTYKTNIIIKDNDFIIDSIAFNNPINVSHAKNIISIIGNIKYLCIVLKLYNNYRMAIFRHNINYRDMKTILYHFKNIMFETTVN